MRTFLSLLGIVGSIFIIKYRERIGDEIGEAEWMRKIGGVSNFVILLAIVVFFWGLAEITGTTGLLFGWMKNFIPGLNTDETPVF